MQASSSQYLRKESILGTDAFKAYQFQKVSKYYCTEFEVQDPVDRNSKLKLLHIEIFTIKTFVLAYLCLEI